MPFALSCGLTVSYLIDMRKANGGKAQGGFHKNENIHKNQKRHGQWRNRGQGNGCGIQ